MQNSDIRPLIDEINRRTGYLWRFLDLPGKEIQIGELEIVMSAPGFWDSPQKAKETTTEVSRLKQLIAPIIAFRRRVDDLQAMAELVDELAGEAQLAEEAALLDTATKMRADLDTLEIQSFLSGKFDHCNAIVSIHAGAGGTESCDWADMLLRMYTRWAERRGYTVELDDIQPGDEAGITRATFRIMGENAYGYIKAERGVHRLVRISPFDANKRRHTTFGAVDVIAEIDDDADLDIKEEDLRIDTFRSSGKGGQHVQKTESAIRITHVPTGLVVTCQTERSQHKNKASAMKILKSRVYEKQQDEKRSEMERFYGEKGDIGWGSQIRSYVFQPYQMIKDLRTGVETSNLQGVMDGDLDRFIHAWLRAGCPRHRNKDIVMED
ncbi:MAG: peptide chain release factor 2 [Verrucomicrobiota bacterium]|nr:peptide chain release factor 2 [Verrucomicrobiota bacterium]